MPAPAGHSLPLLRQKTADRRLLCLLPQQQHCAMPDPTIEPDAARVGHAVAACTFAAPGAANYCRFAHAVRFWGIAAAVFGRQIGSWNWWRIDEKGFPFRKKGHGSAALYCEMEHGSIVVARRNTEVATWYLPSGRSCLLSCLEHGTMTLRIRTGQQVLGEIPHLKAESMVSA